MTMAAGFVARDGVLLCADTLYSDGFTKTYRDKIFVPFGNESKVCFALAGHEPTARMVIERCKETLSSKKLKKASTSAIVTVIQEVVKTAWEQYVDTRPVEEREGSRFYLLIGISEGVKARLFASYGVVVMPVDAFDCFGAGRHLGHYIIEPTYQPTMTVNELVMLAIHALAATKERADGVGGRSQFVAIRDGKISPVFPYDFNEAETYVLRYRQATARLLQHIGNEEMGSDQFQHKLRQFEKTAEWIRATWIDEKAFLELTHNLLTFTGSAIKSPSAQSRSATPAAIAGVTRRL
jgi:20S proteasome alpha/beta subunit